MKNYLHRLIFIVSMVCFPVLVFTQTPSTGRSWQYVATQMPDNWYGSNESVKIAENVLLYQRNTGGWPKNTAMHRPLSESEKAKILEEKGGGN